MALAAPGGAVCRLEDGLKGVGANSEISWTDATFNPWVGCTKVSPGCDHCYAEGWAKRAGQPHLWSGDRRRTSEANWRLPLKWNRDAAAAGMRKRVFCASLADVFDNQVPDEWRADLWELIFATPRLDWMLLTKRPQNISKMLPPTWGSGWPHVWLGTTAENQEEADRRIPHLLAVPAAVRFLSCEPLLGPVNLRALDLGGVSVDALTGFHSARMFLDNFKSVLDGALSKLPRLPGQTGYVSWVICGGESGSGARPMHPEWARSLRDQCAAAGVPFHFKQWGEWAPKLTYAVLSPPCMELVGKMSAGRLLDGVLHDAFPDA